MSDQFCFVIMPFTDELSEVYEEAIKPAVESCNLTCIRVDEVMGTYSIHRRIIEHLSNAKVIIADLTAINPNVFYEMGVAHSLGNNVIMITQTIDNLPFDIRTYKTIFYSNTIRGGQNLKKEIQAAIKSVHEWSQAPSNPVQDFLPAARRPISLATHTQVQQELTQKITELEQIRKEKGQVEAKLAELERKLQELSAAKESTEKEFSANRKDLQEKIDKLQDEKEGLEQGEQFARNQIEQLRLQLQELQATIVQLQKAVAALSNKSEPSQSGKIKFTRVG